MDLSQKDGARRHAAPWHLFAGFLALYAAIAIPALVSSEFEPWPLAVALALAAVLARLSTIDLVAMRLPDLLTLPLLLAGLLVVAVTSLDLAAWHALAAAVGWLLMVGVAAAYRSARGRDGLGLGDAKLFAAAGAWVGPAGLSSVLLIAALAALAVVFTLQLRGASVGRFSQLPFGPFIAVGLWFVWIYGPLA
ncbi:MAG: prepilin peptidase [Hyphomicrobium sp.]